ncbi:zinc finger MYM-type protein 3 isoform X1 [Cimex lectularius]|uniref:TRASH domain-containing protein n=1 Tax=Cimex lectularius TaxID=79782 RepID=A0A8I6RY32_CIMLE|nr:zinc finger MYM-type protein 3 isoform X1 [Cimex lectularius]
MEKPLELNGVADPANGLDEAANIAEECAIKISSVISEDIIQLDSDDNDAEQPDQSMSKPDNNPIDETTDLNLAMEVHDGDIEAIDLCDSGDETTKAKPTQQFLRVVKMPCTVENADFDKNTNDEVIITGDKEEDINQSVIEKDKNRSETSHASENIANSINNTNKDLEEHQIECKVVSGGLRDCLQCARYTSCHMMLMISGLECYLCSDSCLKEYRRMEKLSKEQLLSPAPLSHADFTDVEQVCMTCGAITGEGVLSWEVMDFCNKECLAKYQENICSKCLFCESKVSPAAMGKYCVRFGNEIKQFCKVSCLDVYKKNIKTCCYCQVNVSITDENSTFTVQPSSKDFCSKECVDKFELVMNKSKFKLVAAECAVCAKTKIVMVEVLMVDKTTLLCSDLCMAAYKFVNQIKIGHCYMCKKYFDKEFIKEIVIFQENIPYRFCSNNCMNINILSKRKIMSCVWCKAKKYNFDMIHQKKKVSPLNSDQNSSPVFVSMYICSLNCFTLYCVSLQAGTASSQMCTQCKKIDLRLFQLSMSDGTFRDFCSYDCVKEFTNLSKKGKKFLKVNPHPTNAVDKQKMGQFSRKSTTPRIVGMQKDNTKKIGPPPLVIKTNQAGLTVKTPGLVQATAGQLKNQIVNVLVKPRPPIPIKNKMTQSRVITVTKGVSCRPNINRRGTQTDDNDTEIDHDCCILRGMVPVPVPIYVPVPMAMYSIPVPTVLPVPIPVPVPIFIPTTRNNSKQIFEDIKRIQEKMPSDPFEAEILMMAEMVAGEKKDADDPVTPTLPDNQEPNTQQPSNPESSFISDEVMEGSNTFGDDMLQMALKMASDLEDTLDNSLENSEERGKKRSSDSPNEPSKRRHSGDYEKPDAQMALKFTLGVNAWTRFARNWNKEIELGKEGKQVKTDLLSMMPEELNASLTLFLKEARMANGSDYLPDAKLYLMLGIQYYLFESGRIDDIFCDLSCITFTDTLNEEAKKFLTLYPKQENVITRVEEEHLWEGRHLGAHSPYSLLTALIYFNTKHFNLMTVEEHMQLSFSQISIHEKRCASPTLVPHSSRTSDGKITYLRYTPAQSTLDANPKKKRVYEQYENKNNPGRCPVMLYNFYLSRCPESMKKRNNVFYLQPEWAGVAESPFWYSANALPEETLQKILNRFKMVKEINQPMKEDFL